MNMNISWSYFVGGIIVGVLIAVCGEVIPNIIDKRRERKAISKFIFIFIR